jgi:hypothetical protein
MNGKQVRLYLVDGTAGGLLTAEIMNWTGHVVAAPRSDLGVLLRREEVHRTGVYLLIGENADAPGGVSVYVGEGDEIATRIRQHARSSEQGGKDFWDKLIILTSKDANLTKAHARYLEAKLITAAHAAKRSEVLNGTSPPLIQLPEADVSDMEYYLSQVYLVLPVLGVTAFRPVGSGASRPQEERVESSSKVDSPIFTFEVPRHGLTAQAQEVDGEFTVLTGSDAQPEWIGTDRHPGYQAMHAQLLADGALAVEGKLARFTRDVVFSAPSAAAAVVAGRAANGRTSWIDKQTGQSFGEWQRRDAGVDALEE